MLVGLLPSEAWVVGSCPQAKEAAKVSPPVHRGFWLANRFQGIRWSFKGVARGFHGGFPTCCLRCECEGGRRPDLNCSRRLLAEGRGRLFQFVPVCRAAKVLQSKRSAGRGHHNLVRLCERLWDVNHISDTVHCPCPATDSPNCEASFRTARLVQPAHFSDNDREAVCGVCVCSS